MEYIRTATTEYPTGDRLTLEVESRSGNTVVEGQDVDRVTVQIVVHVWEESADAADDFLDQVMAGIRHHGDTLTIAAPQVSSSGPWLQFGRGARVDYALTVPRRTACRISSRSGRTEVARIAGPVAVEQRSGRAAVRAIAGDVQIVNRSGATEVEDVGGRLVLESRSGKVLVRAVQGDARIASYSGGVQVEGIGGNLEVHARSAAVQVERVGGSLAAHSQSGRVAAGDVGGEARIEARSGAVVLSACRDGARVRTASGSLTFRGPVLGDLDIEAASGGIRLEVDPAHPFFIDAETASGSIHSDLAPRRDNNPPPAGAPAVRVRTASGGIRISRYNGF